MRRALIAVAAFAVAAAIVFATYSFFSTGSDELSIDDLYSTQRTLSADGMFRGKFKPDDSVNAPICDYNYEISGKTLFITVYVSLGDKEPLPVDSEGYVTIEFKANANIEKIYYRAVGRESNLSFEKTN